MNGSESNEKIKECLQQQIDEVDMLSSIFCNPGEFKIDDHSVLADINQYIAGTIKQLHRRLDYTISVPILKNDKLDIHFELPPLYPQVEYANIIAIRSVKSSLNKTTENIIKHKMIEFMKTVDQTEVYIYQVIVWIQENIEYLIKLKIDEDDTKSTENHLSSKTDVELERLWIYSHHLKSKTKRQDIVKLAKDLDLSGFSLPGKPGIICVEGLQTDTMEFWKIVRQWSWHRINVRITETETGTSDGLVAFRRFKEFRELVFIDMNNDDDVQPINMSLFIKFLEQHNSLYVTEQLFGFKQGG